jgi:5-methylcytosine-specific restriction protein B
MTSVSNLASSGPVRPADAPDPVAKAAASYDRGKIRPRLDAAEEQRAEILKRFPKDSWGALPLERYALGQADSEDTYCRWLEFKSSDLGSMSGGSAMKLVIFKRRDQDGWYYPEAHFSSLVDAWATLRHSFEGAFRLADAGSWEPIDLLPALEYGPALCVKSLHVYYPSEILPIYGRDALRHFLRLFGRSNDETKSLRRVALNRLLLEAVHAHPALAGWSTNEVGYFLFDAFDPREVRRIVKIAPGENGKYWEDCVAGGYICVGWDAVGDLSDFKTKSEFKERFRDVFAATYPHKPKLSAKANEVWTLQELSPGDIVVANQGTSKVLAIGEVEEPGYEWRDDRADFRHTVRIRWDTSLARTIDPQPSWATVTVGNVSSALYETILNGLSTVDRGVSAPKPAKLGAPLEREMLELVETLDRKGQLILYGPPGTGKTYTARRLSVAFLQRHDGQDAAATLADTARFATAERDLAAGHSARRVWWAVAKPAEWQWEQLFQKGHESYRQGRLKKNYALLQTGDLVIGYQSTPDKKIVALATVSKPLTNMGAAEPRFEITPLARVANGPTYEDLCKDPVIALSEPMRFRNQGTLFGLTSAEAEHVLGLLIERDPALQDHLPVDEDRVAQLTRLTFHPSYAYEDFIEGFRPYDNGSGSLALRLEDGVFKRVCTEARAHPERRYVVLIDEINRANIGKVFGEIITLLERDKRDLNVTLPQSKESFSVPANVHIVGTMNTADRSIKLLDAALRRRFAFTEVMPDAELLRGAKVGTLALDEFLEELNRRIAREAGREKQIGHSFLLDGGAPITDAEEFGRRFRQEILPLLQEYCYEDYAALTTYLGTELVDSDAGTIEADIVQDSTSLIAALEKEFAGGSPAAG